MVQGPREHAEPLIPPTLPREERQAPVFRQAPSTGIAHHHSAPVHSSPQPPAQPVNHRKANPGLSPARITAGVLVLALLTILLMLRQGQEPAKEKAKVRVATNRTHFKCQSHTKSLPDRPAATRNAPPTASVPKVAPPATAKPQESVPKAKESATVPKAPTIPSRPLPSPPKQIVFPSGKALVLANLDVGQQLHQDIVALERKCKSKTPAAIAFFRDGPSGARDAIGSFKGNLATGPAVFFHPYVKGNVPRHYINFKHGRWHGVLATWNVYGRREFLGNYSNGLRHGFLCLFHNDALTTVLECAHGKIEAVHQITADRLSSSSTGAASAPSAAGLTEVLGQVLNIERDLKRADKSFHRRVKEVYQLQHQIADLQKERIQTQMQIQYTRTLVDRLIDQLNHFKGPLEQRGQLRRRIAEIQRQIPVLERRPSEIDRQAEKLQARLDHLIGRSEADLSIRAISSTGRLEPT